jgi:methionine-rich copper-binding protein CopC
MRILIAAILLFLLASGAGAHAFLDHASPLVGSTVGAAPHEVSLTFAQNLEPAFSIVTVTDASGTEVSQGKAQISGNTMRVSLKPLGPGTYKVRWRVLSVDTHTTQGTFSFHVGRR